MNANIEKAREIFVAAVGKLAPEEWDTYLAEVCAGDVELCRRVKRLLQMDAGAGSFLESPAAAAVATVDEPISERPGTVIGPYKLMEQIGEGGMGLVFVAEQQQPVRRKVALKVIKPGMDTRQVVARFEAERQALALMDHSHIAKVLDGGTTDSGRPYFVMELVKGVPITEYCDHNQLPIRARLELFVSVCQAVQHAHQKGIIHRDIKPSNVLVMSQDGTPVVKVIDFGVAKAIGQQLSDKTIYTQFAQMVGTPLYMSPEQAGESSLDVDTRSDIYSLGVLLYELLTGTTPFDKERLGTVGYDELRRIIREEEPPRPSTRMSTLGLAATTSATQRKSDPRQLSRLFRGELDWIVMKCLEKDRNRRYDTANSLAKDIGHYVHHEPVQACPPSVAYRLRKFVRRNRTAVAIAALAVGLLLLAVIELTVSNRRIAQEQKRTEAQRDEAEANFRKARQAVNDQFTLVSQSTLFEAPGFQSLRKDLLESSLRYYLDFLRQRLDNPELQADVAAAYLRLYQIYMMTDGGHSVNSIQALRKGVEIVEALREHPNDAEVYSRLAGFGKGNREFHSVSSAPRPDPDVALAAFERAASIWENLARDYPNETGFQFDLAEFYAHIHELQLEAHRPALALSALRKSHEINKKLAREKPQIPEYRAELAFTHRHLAELLESAGPPDEVEDHYRRFLELSLSMEAEWPEVPFYHVMVADALRVRAGWLADTDRLREAEQAYRRAANIFEKWPKYPSVPSNRGNLAFCYDSLGDLLRQTGKTEKAEEIYHQALIIWQKLADEFPSSRGYRRRLALSSFNRCLMLAAGGRLQEAEQVHAKVLAYEPQTADEHNEIAWRLATSPDARFRAPARALALAKQAVKLEPAAEYWNTLGVAQYRAGNWKDAVAALERSVKSGGSHGLDWFFLAMSHWRLGDKEQARKFYAQAIQWMEKKPPRNQDLRQELRRFRAEAAGLLGIKDQPATNEKETTDAKAPGRKAP
jgi:serine/threonine protein kinase/Tfp pilus assembly protein PilF